jgi:inorganic phosphate transporter, PiT family
MNQVLVFVLLAIVYGYAFFAGKLASTDIIGTAIGSRIIKPYFALVIVSSMSFFGAIFGGKVAQTFTQNLVDPQYITSSFLFGSLIAICIWIGFTYFYGLPTSDTHTLVGAFIGSAIALRGISSIRFDTLQSILIALFVSPFIGYCIGFVLEKILHTVFFSISQKQGKRIFSILNTLSISAYAFASGQNDTQKHIALALLTVSIAGGSNVPYVGVILPFTIACICSLGSFFGGLRTLKTIGFKITPLSPDQSFAAQATTAVITQITAFVAIPISTTQALTASIVGTAAAKRKSSIRWGMLEHIAVSWILTIPVSCALGFVITWLLKNVL